MAFYENDVGVLIEEQKLQARVRELGAELERFKIGARPALERHAAEWNEQGHHRPARRAAALGDR